MEQFGGEARTAQRGPPDLGVPPPLTGTATAIRHDRSASSATACWLGPSLAILSAVSAATDMPCE